MPMYPPLKWIRENARKKGIDLKVAAHVCKIEGHEWKGGTCLRCAWRCKRSRKKRTFKKCVKKCVGRAR